MYFFPLLSCALSFRLLRSPAECIMLRESVISLPVLFAFMCDSRRSLRSPPAFRSTFSIFGCAFKALNFRFIHSKFFDRDERKDKQFVYLIFILSVWWCALCHRLRARSIPIRFLRSVRCSLFAVAAPAAVEVGARCDSQAAN